MLFCFFLKPILTSFLNFVSAKHCDRLTAKLEGQTLSFPCFSSFGSTCFFGCRPGYFLQGDGKANCTLNSKGDGVSWKIEQFSCKGNSRFFLSFSAGGTAY